MGKFVVVLFCICFKNIVVDVLRLLAETLRSTCRDQVSMTVDGLTSVITIIYKSLHCELKNKMLFFK